MELISMAQAGAQLSPESHKQALQRGISFPNMSGMTTQGTGLEIGAQVQKAVNGLWNGFGKGLGKSVFGNRAAAVGSLQQGLANIYMFKIRSIEEKYKFHHFSYPLLNAADFDSKPSVLLLGACSTGKTTVVQRLLGAPYTGAVISPDPSTDRFVVVDYGADGRVIQGNNVIAQTNSPYHGLDRFGASFANCFQQVNTPSEMAQCFTLVDTPGLGWFAERADVIMLLFDPSKLDISDDCMQTISSLRRHSEKIRVVLNKAGEVSQSRLMSVHGALMWGLGRVIQTPEAARVYVCSLRADRSLRSDINPKAVDFFQAEHEALISHLDNLPYTSCNRKVRALEVISQNCQILCRSISTVDRLKKSVPMIRLSGQTAKKNILDNLDDHFEKVNSSAQLSAADLPPVESFRQKLAEIDLFTLPALDKKALPTVNDVLEKDIPALQQQFASPYG